MTAVSESRFSSSSPEEFLVGLHVPTPEEGGEPWFAMPRVGPASGTSRTLWVLDELVRHPQRLKQVKSTVVHFIPTNDLHSKIVVHGLSQLMDVVLAELLTTVDTTSFRAALTALQDALTEPREDLKQMFRAEARSALRDAYLRLHDATAQKKDSWTYRSSNGLVGEGALRNMHDLATQAALVIAWTSYLDGSRSAALTWSGRAREQFDAYAASLGSTVAVNVGNVVDKGLSAADTVSRFVLPFGGGGVPRNLLRWVAPETTIGVIAVGTLDVCRRSYARLAEDRLAFNRLSEHLRSVEP